VKTLAKLLVAGLLVAVAAVVLLTFMGIASACIKGSVLSMYADAFHSLMPELGGFMSAVFGLLMLIAMAISFIFIVAVGTLAWKLLASGTRSVARDSEVDEARMIQDIYHGLTKMQDRVEALETLLMDAGRKETKS
jgi:phage shock protein B